MLCCVVLFCFCLFVCLFCFITSFDNDKGISIREPSTTFDSDVTKGDKGEEKCVSQNNDETGSLKWYVITIGNVSLYPNEVTRRGEEEEEEI